jgi:hypothetical protein
MALIKTIASYRDEAGNIVPQRDIQMHALEEAEIQAHWKYGDLSSKIPEPISVEQEHNWLIENGADFVKQKRTEREQAIKDLQPHLDEALKAHMEASVAWSHHVELCVANNIDPDTFDGDARYLLKIPT